MKKKLSLFIGLMALGGILAGGTLGEANSGSSWQLAADRSGRPEYELSRKLTVDKAELILGPSERHDDVDYQWMQLSFSRENGDVYQIWLLADGLPSADRGMLKNGVVTGNAPRVARYLYREPRWDEAVEFFNPADGSPLLPKWDFWSYGFFRTPENNALRDVMAQEVKFQGFPFRRSEGTLSKFALPDKVRKVPFNSDLMIGFSFTWRDVEGRSYFEVKDKTHQFVQLSETDERNDIAAGINMHTSEVMHDFLWREPVYISRLFWYPADWPAHLYRPNFRGRALYVDEPGIHLRGKIYGLSPEEAKKLSPSMVADRLEDAGVEPMWRTEGNQDYSVLWYNKFIDARFGRGDIQIVENDNAVWEIFYETAYYQLARPDSPKAFIDEDAEPETLVERYNMALGTQIMPTIENVCAIETAILRGAARNFDKKWGVSLYNNYPEALNIKMDTAAWNYFYDAGATYFWFWNEWPGFNPNVAHIPFSYKRAMAANLKQHAAARPQRDMNALRNAATVCLLLPDGYTFSWHNLFGLKHLYLDAVNGKGKTYRQILSQVATEVERCLRDGVKFDIAVNDERFAGKGYDELVIFEEDGSVIRRNNQNGETRYAYGELPPLMRPDLGASPRIGLEIAEKNADSIVVKVKPELGTGQWARDLRGDILTDWNVITPDGMSEFIFFDNPGLEKRVATPQKGVYLIRVALVDCFGRPAVATIEYRK